MISLDSIPLKNKEIVKSNSLNERNSLFDLIDVKKKMSNN